MSNFINQIFKGVIKSAANQVGREGGRLISNKIFNRSDASRTGNEVPVVTPDAESNDFVAKDGTIVTFPEGQGIPVEWIAQNFSPIIYRTSFTGNLTKLVILGLLPAIGEVFMLIKAIEEFFVSEVGYQGLKVVPHYVADSRFKQGYRQDGYRRDLVVFYLPVGKFKPSFILKGLMWIILAVGLGYLHFPLVIYLMKRF